MKRKPKHRSMVHLTVLDDRTGLMVAETDKVTDAMRAGVCLGTHCAGRGAPVFHRNRRFPAHTEPAQWAAR